MKKFLSLFITMLMVVSFSTVVLALENKVINNVSVTGIDVPFSNSPTFDTTGVVKSGSGYRIYGISWKIPRETVSGFYEVTVTLKTNVGYIFSGDVSGTINGKSIAGYRIVDEDELDIVYAFDENSTTDDSSSNITPSISIVRHKITVYCNTEKGSITPIVVRVLEGKNQTFTITPKEGYKIKDVIVDGESVGAVSEYTFKRVKEEHTIRAYFEEIEAFEEIEENGGNVEIKPMLKTLLEILRAFI